MEVEEKWGFHYVIFLWDITVLIFYAFLLKSFIFCMDSGLGENSHLWEPDQVGRLWITFCYIVV